MFGEIIVHTYQPGEKAKWLAFEKKVTDILSRECMRYYGDKIKALTAAEAELKILAQENPMVKAKISYHVDIAAKRFLED